MSLFKKLKLPFHWNEKTKGDIAEIAFHLKASVLGLAVSKPYGDNQPFDFIVTTLRIGSVRVQVKSAWSFWNSSYSINPRRSPGAGPGEGYDFLVVYVAPCDAWYVIPAEELKGYKSAYFNPRSKRRMGRFEHFRDAWHFLTGDHADDHRLIGLTIHAAAGDSGDAELISKPELELP